jgi:GntR family transcriptional regulator / MocR family aminotransferase
MFFRPQSTGPIYQQLYRRLREAILAGELGPGAQLPTTRALASEAGVSRNTILLAYDQLRAEGYIDGQVGAGTFVARELPDEAPVRRVRPATGERKAPAKLGISAYARRAQLIRTPLMTLPGRSIRYDFRYGLPGIAEFPRDVWRRLLARHALRFSTHTARYAGPAGLRQLREAIADYVHRARAVECGPDRVLIVNGSQQALDLVARVLVDPGDRVLIEDPHYIGAREAFLAAGAKLVPCPVDQDGMAIERAPKAARRARLAYVTPSHQFPTGAVMPLARRLALLAWAGEAGAYVVEDDDDSEFRYSGRPVEAVQALDSADQVIYVGTMSKTLFPALRLGFLVLPPALVEPFRAVKHLSDRHTSTMQQAVLADFIAEGHFERHVRRTRARNAKRRAALLEALHAGFGDRVVVQGSNAGLHLMVWFRDRRIEQTDAIIAAAASAGVGVYPVAPYYLGEPASAGLLLGYAALDEREIAAAIRLLAGAI